MRALSSRPFCPCDSRQVSLGDLSAAYRDTTQCYQTIRELRWPDGVTCPFCESTQIIKRGFDDTESARQRYECTDCHTRFDDLTDPIFAGHHQPLKVWVLCLYFMGLHLSNEQIAFE